MIGRFLRYGAGSLVAMASRFVLLARLVFSDRHPHHRSRPPGRGACFTLSLPMAAS